MNNLEVLNSIVLNNYLVVKVKIGNIYFPTF